MIVYSLKKIGAYYRLYINNKPSNLGYSETNNLGQAKLNNNGAPIVKDADVYIPTGYPTMLQNGYGMYSLKAIMITGCHIEIFGPMLTPHHSKVIQENNDLGTNFPWNDGYWATIRVESSIENPNTNNIIQAQHWSAITTIIYRIINSCRVEQPSNKLLKDLINKYISKVKKVKMKFDFS